MGNKANPDVTMSRRNRMVRIEDLWLRGCTNKSQIASSLDVSTTTVSRDMKCIEQNWMRTTVLSMQKKLARRVEQLEAIAYVARHGYDVSRPPNVPGVLGCLWDYEEARERYRIRG